VPTARYDGQTEWYELFAGAAPHNAARDFAIALLGSGPGRCLDLGCGTGRAVPGLVNAGWSVVGVDISRDQLDAARQSFGDAAEWIRGDAHSLPFYADEFDAVISLFTHTDYDKPTEVFEEARRILKGDGVFVYLGAHPVFGSPFVAREAASDIENAVAIVRPGYQTAGWRPRQPDPLQTKITTRVGINHQPLAELLNAIISSGFVIESVHEPGDGDIPMFMALRLRPLEAFATKM
jgi:SAM-dependent methyltransferase